MARMTAEQIREKLTSEFVKAAFDTMNDLGPESWTLIETKKSVNLTASHLETSTDGGVSVSGLTGHAAPDLDNAVLQQHENLLERAAQEGTIVVANAFHKREMIPGERKEYVLDTETNKFKPYTP